MRNYLGKTQAQLASLLFVSSRSIHGYEQGWRDITPQVERQLLFLLSLKRIGDKSIKPCWKIKKCPDEWKGKCSAWEFKAGSLCWYITGTFCQGEGQDSWEEKLKKCEKCEVFLGLFPAMADSN